MTPANSLSPLIYAVILLSPFALPEQPLASSWTIEPVANEGSGQTSLRVNSLDEPCVAYQVPGPGLATMIWYATRSGGVWSVSSIGVQRHRPLWPSLALASDDAPHVAYLVRPDTLLFDWDLEYAVNNGGGWTFETVDAVASTALPVSIDLDGADHPHVAFVRDTEVGAHLMYATRATGSWLVEPADDTGVSPQHPSLAVDGVGQPHISYGGSGSLMYAVKFAGNWHRAAPDDSGRAEDTSIVVDGSGVPHISYNSQPPWASEPVLRYAKRVGGTWLVETVDPTVRAIDTSIALDSQGNPHIVYEDNSNEIMRIAAKYGNAWVIETVDDVSFEPGRGSAIAFDSSDMAHVSYLPGGLGEVLYAYRATLLPVEMPGGEARIRLSAPQPNPSTGLRPATIVFSTSGTQSVSFGLFDARGRRVSFKPAKTYAPGDHRISWSAPGGEPGVYFLVMSVGDGTVARTKLVFTR